jgi:hypothetical protein
VANLLPNGKQQYLDPATGDFLVGGKLYTYAANTSLATPKATYTNQAGSVSNTNPIILDAYGQATVFWNGAYDAVLKDSSDNIIGTYYGISTLTDAADVSYSGATLASILLNNLAYSVDSITDLRAIDKTEYTHAIVMGYYAGGDGGGGVYWYDSGDTTTADNGGSVIVADDSGRWKLLTFGQPMSVLQFGAISDGTTDSSDAFNDAFAALGTDGGIITALGNYKLSDDITVPENIHLKGFNGTATIRSDGNYLPSNYASTLIMASGKKITRSNGSAITGFLILTAAVAPSGAYALPWIDDATAQSAIANYSGTAIYGSAVLSGRLEDLIIIGFQYGVYDSGGYGSDTQMTRVLADCTNGFYVSNDETITPYSAVSAMRLKDCVASAIACDGQGFTSVTRSGNGFAIDGFNVLHCSTILDGFVTYRHATGIVTNTYCALVNSTGIGTVTGLSINGADVRVIGGSYAGGTYGITVHGGATYAIDGATMEGASADLYIYSGAGYGTLNNYKAVNSLIDGDATALLKCTIGAARQSVAPKTFTPSLEFGGAAVGMTYTTQLGLYRIVGNYVHGSVKIVLSAVGSSTGSAKITGLPIPLSAVAGSVGTGVAAYFYHIGVTGTQAGGITCDVVGSTLELYTGRDGAGVNSSYMTEARFQNDSQISINFSYPIDR